jgi:hypothetical protein
MHVYGARGPLSDTPQLGEYEVVLAHEANASIAKVTAVALEQILGADDDLDQAIKEAYLLGERDMLAKCIAALPHDTHCLDTWYDDKTSECFCKSAACDRALRALEEKPTPPPLPPSVGVPEKRGSLW